MKAISEPALRILITNLQFGLRTGTEIVVRDFSLGLSARGHDVTVYSPALAALAEETRAKGIRIIDDLLELDDPPDIIHAHHISPTIEAIVRFPQTPVVWLCHSSDGWIDAPPIFPQVHTYAAVDEITRDRVLGTPGVPADRVTILPNAVDLGRIPARIEPLPERPRRALVFGKATAAAPLIEECCRIANLTFAAIGSQTGTAMADPEPELAKADIVFASARAALEAMAAGAAVVVMDSRGVADMARTSNLDFLRANNFGLRILSKPVTSEAILEAIAGYDAADAAAVSACIRQEANLEHTLDRLETLYREAIVGFAPFDGATAKARADAQTRALHAWLPRPSEGPGFWRDEYQRLTTHIDELTRAVGHYQLQTHRKAEEATALAVDLAAARAGFEALAADLAASRTELDAEVRRRTTEADRAAVIGRENTQLSEKTRQLESALAEFQREIATMRLSRPYRLGRWLRHSFIGRLLP